MLFDYKLIRLSLSYNLIRLNLKWNSYNLLSQSAPEISPFFEKDHAKSVDEHLQTTGHNIGKPSILTELPKNFKKVSNAKSLNLKLTTADLNKEKMTGAPNGRSNAELSPAMTT